MLVELEKPSMVPALAEPWFLSFDADVEFHVVMGPEELEQAGLDKLGEKWGRIAGGRRKGARLVPKGSAQSRCALDTVGNRVLDDFWRRVDGHFVASSCDGGVQELAGDDRRDAIGK